MNRRADRYPLTIGGVIERGDTGETTPITARRTGEIDEQGCEVYRVDVPAPAHLFRSRRVTVHLDMVPAKASMVLQFEPDPTPAPGRTEPVQAGTQDEYPQVVSDAYTAGAGRCKRCLGDGRIAAGTEHGDPWPVWAALPPGSDLAVQAGLVWPEPCPACDGTGDA